MAQTNGFFDITTLTRVAGWYFFSVASPVINKYVQSSFPFTNSLSVLYLLTASIVGYLLFRRSTRKVDDVLPVHTTTPAFHYQTLPPLHLILKDLLPLGLAKFFGTMLLLFGIKNLPVSSVLTMKALDPVPTIFFMYFILRETEPFVVIASVVPIIFGVALSSYSSSAGGGGWLVVAFCLVVVDAFQNVFTKSLLNKGVYNEYGIQFLSSTLALMMQLPICWFYEGLSHVFGILFLQLPCKLLMIVALACTSYYGQVVMAFMVMSKVTNLTYSVANIAKRLVQLLVAMLIFRNPVTLLNGVGMVIAMLSVTFYSAARIVFKNSKGKK
eukprot:TRINITY_DN3339_c0_g1_i1.p1 TRINITY_DN3339_c0_g1~~TRINITY_DN3339_c0_g1_i1.p1  ORF type:complete len:373 (-),score=61.12 TRINITY_DN3339_c0_g1_i1:132-1112(-)